MYGDNPQSNPEWGVITPHGSFKSWQICGFRGEVKNASANQRLRRSSCFSDRPKNNELGRARRNLAPYQVSLNSVQQ